MAKFIATDVYVEINNVDLSDHANAVDISLEKDRIDVSGFNPTGSKEFLPGAAEEEFEVTFLQDFASAKVHATLMPLYLSGDSFPWEIRPTSTDTANALSGTANLFEYHPIDAELGEVAETTVTFAISGGITSLVS